MSDDDIRAEVEAWLAAHWHGLPEPGAQFGRDPRAAWLAQVRDAGWAVPTWPAAWYGRDHTPDQARVVERAFAAAGAPGAGQDRTNLWARTLMTHGADPFRREVVPQLLAGELGMCLLYSEPGAGSDLAAVRTRADPTTGERGGGWVVNGQKVWTSGAGVADYGMLIARTDWDAPKHRGLSFFFLPMKQDGVEVRPLKQVTGEAQFNEVFLTDAFVPAANLLAREGEGWQVLQAALAYERAVMGDRARGSRGGGGGGEFALLRLARERGRLGEPVIRQQLAQVMAWRALNRLNTARAKADGESASIHSLGKLAMSRILHAEAALMSKLLGPDALLDGPGNPQADNANFLTLNAYFTSIGGGTDQIQRNIIGERVLGLPREPEVDRNTPFRDVRAG